MKHLALLFTLFAFCCVPCLSDEPKRPNFLFILVDDQSPFDLKCYDPASPLETPHIDQLARDGMVFDGAYHMGSFSGAVCTPSRHMIMSGRTLWHLPIAPQAMKSAQQTIRDVVYGVYNGGTKPGMRSVKKGDWKLIKYDVLNGSVRETQLFNLKENPNEFIAHHHAPEVTSLTGVTPEPHQVNLATDPKHADKLAELEALLLDEMRRRNDPWRLWNQPSDGLANASDANAATIRKKK